MRPRLKKLLRWTGRTEQTLLHPTPFTVNEKARKQRNEDAVRLVEDDTFAYVVVRLHKPSAVARGRIEVSGHVLPPWWPSFRETFERLIHAGDEFFPQD